MMTTSSGAVVWSAKYSSFGKATVDVSSTVVNPLRFPGQYEDSETGFHQNWQRYYDPAKGRYIRKDPIGFLSGRINLYTYAGGSPIVLWDELGLADPGSRSWPKDCCQLDNSSRLEENIRKLESDFKNSRKWLKTYNELSKPQAPNDRQPELHRMRNRSRAWKHYKGYKEHADSMCRNARKTLDLIQKCMLNAFYSTEQKVLFQTLESTYNKFCNQPPPPPPPTGNTDPTDNIIRNIIIIIILSPIIGPTGIGA